MTGRRKVRRREEKEIRKVKLPEAHFLMSECQVPIAKVAKRLRQSYCFLRRVNKLGLYDPETAFIRWGTDLGSRGLRKRARDIMRELFDTA